MWWSYNHPSLLGATFSLGSSKVSTIAVIGHGRSPEGRKWGKYIDKCDTVVRMWNWAWQTKQDYGRKYDYGFFEINSTEMARFNGHNAQQPEKGWVATELNSNASRKKYRGELPPRTVLVDAKPWVVLARKLGGEGETKPLTLTRGVRAAAWAIQHVGKGGQVILVGFDNVRAGMGLTIEEGYPPAYVAHPSGSSFRDYQGGTRRYSSHDYGVEGPFLEALAAKAKVTLVHAQDLWKASS